MKASDNSAEGAEGIGSSVKSCGSEGCSSRARALERDLILILSLLLSVVAMMSLFSCKLASIWLQSCVMFASIWFQGFGELSTGLPLSGDGYLEGFA